MPIERPLTGEPLALDLVNTEWMGGEHVRDLLDTPAGHAQWLDERGLDGPVTDAAREALVAARRTLRAVLEHRDDGAALGALDALLGRGRLRLRAGPEGPREELEIDPDQRAGWLAARDLLALLEQHPGRLHECANPDCIVWFLDATRSGTRRWCSMAVCGNRLKARRHYERRHVDAR